ncbi:hypothetical protein ACOMHN_030191 [Nucella lapillus]
MTLLSIYSLLCFQVRRTIVRQKVLKKCLEMRKRKIVARDPTKTFGQYGGKSLWAMSREIDGVIADNHPKIRRMKRVEEVMRHSLESGAILDDEAVSRRMEAFFQLKQARKEKSPQHVPELAPEQRHNLFKPPSWATNSETVSQENVPSNPASTTLEGPSGQAKQGDEVISKESPDKEKVGDSHRTKKTLSPTGKYSDNLGVASEVSLDVDSKGRLRGIITNQLDEAGKERGHNTPPEERGGSRSERKPNRTESANSDKARRRGGGNHHDEDPVTELKNVQYDASKDRTLTRSRSRLILPPIEPTKAMVTRT